MKTKQIEIDKIEMVEEYYPRTHERWQNTLNYSENLKAGETLPRPLLVPNPKKEGFYITLDGWHTTLAWKKLGAKTVEADIDEHLQKSEWLSTAIKRNVTHGESLNFSEKIMNAHRLLKLGWTNSKICKLLGWTEAMVDQFEKHGAFSTETEQVVSLKKPLLHLGGKTYSTKQLAKIEEVQQGLSGLTQLHYIQSITSIIENGMLDKKNKSVLKALQKLYWILRGLKISEMKIKED